MTHTSPDMEWLAVVYLLVVGCVLFVELTSWIARLAKERR